MNTKVTGMDQIVGSLSGGNMQKVVLSKWLLNDPDIIILMNRQEELMLAQKQRYIRL